MEKKEVRLTVNDVLAKDMKLVGYLVVSGGLGYVLAAYVAKDPALTAIFAPAINYALYRITKEMEHEGYRDAVR
jgi:hypothetical protein